MTLPTRLEETLQDLELFEDRNDRIQALIETAERFRNPDESVVPRTSPNRVPGCESEVFVERQKGGSIKFAVDNPQGISAMALAVILEEGCVGATNFEIGEIPEELVYRVFGRELSMGKSLGLTGMVKMLRHKATT